MFKTIALKTLLVLAPLLVFAPHILRVLILILSFFPNAMALAPIVQGMVLNKGIDSLSEAQGISDEAMDIFDSSSDLLEELGEDSENVNSLTKSFETYSRRLSQLKSDMRDLGYAEEEIESLSENLSSRERSISQKLRSLTKTLRSVKRIKNTVSKFFSKKGTEVALSRGLLSTNQQALHLQIEQIQAQELKDLEDKKAKLAFQKSMLDEVNKSARSIEERRLKELKITKNEPVFHLSKIQSYALNSSLFLIILGSLALMFNFFQQEGKNALKAGMLGLILSYVLPGIVHLYKTWLGV